MNQIASYSVYYKKMLGSYQVRPGHVSVGTSLFEILDPPLTSHLYTPYVVHTVQGEI